jgi:hypothetical protein
VHERESVDRWARDNGGVLTDSCGAAWLEGWQRRLEAARTAAQVQALWDEVMRRIYRPKGPDPDAE